MRSRRRASCSRWAWPPARRGPTASCCGRAWRPTRCRAAAWVTRPSMCAGKWRTTSASGASWRRARPLRTKNSRTPCTSKYRASHQGGRTGTASPRPAHAAPSAVRAPHLRKPTTPGKPCASPSPPASSTSRASTPRTATWPRSRWTSSCTWATTSTKAPGARAMCASTRAASRRSWPGFATATRSTRPTRTCRPRTPPALGW
jgi:hypothetical protein